jgi:hypothetical protein
MIQLVWVFGYTHYMKSLIVEKKTEKVWVKSGHKSWDNWTNVCITDTVFYFWQKYKDIVNKYNIFLVKNRLCVCYICIYTFGFDEKHTLISISQN